MLDPEQLHALRPPTLLLWGRSERVLPTSHLEFFRKHLPARPRGGAARLRPHSLSRGPGAAGASYPTLRGRDHARVIEPHVGESGTQTHRTATVRSGAVGSQPAPLPDGRGTGPVSTSLIVERRGDSDDSGTRPLDGSFRRPLDGASSCVSMRMSKITSEITITTTATIKASRERSFCGAGSQASGIGIGVREGSNPGAGRPGRGDCRYRICRGGVRRLKGRRGVEARRRGRRRRGGQRGLALAHQLARGHHGVDGGRGAGLPGRARRGRRRRDGVPHPGTASTRVSPDSEDVEGAGLARCGADRSSASRSIICVGRSSSVEDEEDRACAAPAAPGPRCRGATAASARPRRCSRAPSR